MQKAVNQSLDVALLIQPQAWHKNHKPVSQNVGISLRMNPKLSPCSIVVFTDCKQLVDEFEDYYSINRKDSRVGIFLTDLNLNPVGLSLKHVNRRFNLEAHDLANRGKNFKEVRWNWADF